MFIVRLLAVGLVMAPLAIAQTPPQPTDDPFPLPIAVAEGVVRVNFREFASLPDVDGEAARMMLLVDEPGTRRLVVSDMNGLLYTVSYDGQRVTPYLDLRDPRWAVSVQSRGSERGLQSFAFHPQFNRRGTPGFGKFYTFTDTSDTSPTPDFRPGGGNHTHDTILLEWTARTPDAASYDGGPPRELLRLEQPFQNHNGGHITFNPLVAARDADFGLLYVGVADGGSGGDPLDLAQNLNSPFGKILRIDPLGKNSANGKYGIPGANPFANDGKAETLGEIYAYGVRNPQRLFWDSKTGRMFMSDIGQNIVEEISPITAGANLGRQLHICQSAGEHGEPAKRPECHVSRRGVRTARSAASEKRSRHRRPCVSPHSDSTVDGPPDLRRQPQWRSVLRQRRRASSQWRAGCHSASAV
jgi:Glucose / Sorbosone dehydrogenase